MYHTPNQSFAATLHNNRSYLPRRVVPTMLQKNQIARLKVNEKMRHLVQEICENLKEGHRKPVALLYLITWTRNDWMS